MNKLHSRWLLILVLLFSVNCEGKNPASNEESPKNHVTDVKIDTLCFYPMNMKPYGQYVFQNETHLTVFLEFTGYDENNTDNSRIFKKMTHQPDFKKWTYVAFADRGWPRIMGNISHRNDTVIINYIQYLPPNCGFEPDCRQYAPPHEVVFVYFIPYTEKPIKFAEVIKRFGEE